MADKLTALVCARNEVIRATLAKIAVAQDYAVVAEADSDQGLLALQKHYSPDLILLDDELQFVVVAELIADVKVKDPGCAVLLISNDPGGRERAMSAGAFGVVYRAKLSELHGAANRARRWLEDAEKREAGERRTGEDRRRRQDWAQVTSERRETERRNRDIGPPGSSTNPFSRSP